MNKLDEIPDTHFIFSLKTYIENSVCKISRAMSFIKKMSAFEEDMNQIIMCGWMKWKKH